MITAAKPKPFGPIASTITARAAFWFCLKRCASDANRSTQQEPNQPNRLRRANVALWLFFPGTVPWPVTCYERDAGIKLEALRITGPRHLVLRLGRGELV